MIDQRPRDDIVDVLPHEGGLELIAPSGLSIPVSIGAAEALAARLLEAVRTERELRADRL